MKSVSFLTPTEKAYEILERVTPLRFDCGVYCNQKCCRGGKNDGMFLFPGEEKRFIDVPGYTVAEKENGKVLICSGTCMRAQRPLACRFFPFFPYVTEKDGELFIRVMKDIRAFDFCPIGESEATLAFRRAVRLAAKALLREPKNAEFLLQQTELLLDFGEL